MKHTTFIAVVITALLTSVVWLLIINARGYNLFGIHKTEEVTTDSVILTSDEESDPQPATKAKAEDKSVTGAENIIGWWVPVEGSECVVEFTKYGTFNERSKHSTSLVYDEYTYTSTGSEVVFKDKYGSKDRFTYTVTKEGGKTYLEIYNHTHYGGKYKKK